MNPNPRKVLLLCTGNSARSIIGEYLLREKGKGRFEVFWSSPDPSTFQGTEDEKKMFFVQLASQIAQRVDLFCAFPEE